MRSAYNTNQSTAVLGETQHTSAFKKSASVDTPLIILGHSEFTWNRKYPISPSKISTSVTSAITRARVTILLICLHLNFTFREETVTHGYVAEGES